MTDYPDIAHNLRIYGWIRLLMMRVYLPLAAIYLVADKHVTLPQLGILTSIAGITALLLNIPTGYLADRWTRKAAVVTGATAIASSAFAFAFLPGFIGALVATILDSAGYAIISGGAEALIHDTLVMQNRANDYVQVLGHAQSFALTGNVLAISLVPLTYPINHRLPFIIAGITGIVFVVLAASMVEPARPKSHASESTERSLFHTLWRFVTPRSVLFFVAIGILSATYRAYPNFANLAIKDMGLNPGYIGFVFAVASIFGAINGRYIYVYKRLTLMQYALFDVSMGMLYLLVIGLTRNLILTLIFFVLNMGFWRIRSIMYQDQLLRKHGQSAKKATLVSTIGFFDSINFWIAPLVALCVAHNGYYKGFVIISIVGWIIIGMLMIVAITILNRSRPTTNA